MPYHRGMQHHLTGLGDVLKLRVAASSNELFKGRPDTLQCFGNAKRDAP